MAELAEQRRDHHFELYRSGRWKHYYTEEQFLAEMRKAVENAERGRDRALPRSEASVNLSKSRRRPNQYGCMAGLVRSACYFVLSSLYADVLTTGRIDRVERQPNGSERKILDWLGGQRHAMLALLETLVNTDSGSYDKAGVDAVGGHIREFLDEPRHRERGHARREIRRRHHRHRRPEAPPLGNRPILLMGHRDTVFPKGEPTRRPFKIEGGRAYGRASPT